MSDTVSLMPHVTLSLMPDLATEDGDGYMHMPLVIESWPEGLNVELILREALRMIEEEGGYP
jgi:hypothetical protein